MQKMTPRNHATLPYLSVTIWRLNVYQIRFPNGLHSRPISCSLFKGPVCNLRGGKRNRRRWGGREGPVKMRSLGPGMACMHLTLRVQRVKLEGPELHVSSASQERRNVNRNGPRVRQRELVCAREFAHRGARPHLFSEIFSKKINAIIFGPPIGRGPPPHCGVCGVSSYATDTGHHTSYQSISPSCQSTESN